MRVLPPPAPAGTSRRPLTTRAIAVFVVLTALFALGVVGVAALLRATADADIEQAALDGATQAGHFVGLGPDRGLQEGLSAGRLSKDVIGRLDARRAQPAGRNALSGIVVRDRGGRVLYSAERGEIGERHASTAGFRAALAGRPVSVICSPAHPCEHDDADLGELVQTFVPIRGSAGDSDPVGVYELELSYATLAANLERADRRIGVVLAATAIVAWIALLPFSWRLSRLVAERRPLARWRTLRALRRGIARGEIEVHFQPKVDLGSRRTVGAEALVRWRRNGALVPPAAFLPWAEDTDVMASLTDEVLAQTLRYVDVWARDGVAVPVAVNVSPATLIDASLPQRVRAALARYGVAPGLLTLEVTETAVLEQPDRAQATLDDLSRLGITLSVDDFGTGYSSLSRLHLFPIDEIKIDRSFVTSIPRDGTRYVGGIVRLADDLGLSVVAEGVETEEVCGQLRELGCELAQGYLFSAPLPAAEFRARLADEEAARAVIDDVLAEQLARPRPAA